MESEPNTHFTAESSASALPPATGSSTINIGTSERIVSAFGGAALTIIGMRNLGTLSGITMVLGGGYLLVRGLSGYCAISNLIGQQSERKNASAMEARSTFTVNKPRADVYAFWRKLENLPRFMQHLDQVIELDDKRSTWKAKIPGADKMPGNLGIVSWEAEIVEDISGELISWHSMPGSTVDNAGEVRFKDASDGKGTAISACISYRLPAGDLGMVAAKLVNPALKKIIREDLRSFKILLETDNPSPNKETRSKSSERTGNRSEYSVSG